MKSPLLTAALAAGLLGATAHAADTKLPKQLDGIDIVDRQGAELPRELLFRDQDGKPVRLGDYLDGKQPLMVVLAYYQCPMLCSIVLNGVTDGAKKVAFAPGKGYRLLTVSIDPRDTFELASAKRKTYLDALGKPLGGTRGWDFLIGSPDAPDAVKTLADTGDGYTVAIMRIMRIGGALTVVVLGAFLLRLWRRERERTRKTRTEHQTA
jgi:protein SCO1